MTAIGKLIHTPDDTLKHGDPAENYSAHIVTSESCVLLIERIDMDNELRSISGVVDLMDSNPVMEFLLGCNDSQNKELVENNPKRTWLEKAMLNEGWSRWKKKHSKGVVGLASGSLVATFIVAARLIVGTRPDSQSHSLPAVLGQEFLLIALVFITTLLNYGILRDKEVVAEKIARRLASILRWASLILPLVLIAAFLAMLVAFVAALYWSQGITSELLRYIGSLIVVWIVIFVYLGLGSFCIFQELDKGVG